MYELKNGLSLPFLVFGDPRVNISDFLALFHRDRQESCLKSSSRVGKTRICPAEGDKGHEAQTGGGGPRIVEEMISNLSTRLVLSLCSALLKLVIVSMYTCLPAAYPHFLMNGLAQSLIHLYCDDGQASKTPAVPTKANSIHWLGVICKYWKLRKGP